ncbi:MAG: hypothetical protein A2939_00975 [Parcubacteria group bacterium RIFCSPLOWO2_01_FULL_48_18]|nr:MAG: hypothetical protein A3J67_04860 [Parcubacteria group bacterium RIFCSPHIGHO2_02_FULL_48_10b]OHB22045.1 MAG: hypothetical protein A2939_00975 [Parcubacteria group bacterium RIFCSPLOWO2_01_FULL_48_18]
METLLKADIFFFITAVAIIIVAGMFAVALVYAVKILKDVKYISSRAKEETDKIAGDIDELRAEAKEEGGKLKYLFHSLTKLFIIKKKGRK